MEKPLVKRGPGQTWYWQKTFHIDGLVQERRNSIANTQGPIQYKDVVLPV